MDNWSAAFTAIGGLAAVGGLIDLALYKSEKERLKAHLEDWWLRFTDVKWSNFGRAEAELAINILDRWAGPRLWSWKRWRFSVIVTVGVYVLVTAWVLVRAAWNGGDIDILRGQPPIDVAYELILFIVPVTVAFVLSLSVTRYIATSAAQLCRGAFFNSLVFSLLLVIHLLLLLSWSAIVFALEMVAMEVPRELINYFLSNPSTNDPAEFWIALRDVTFGRLMAMPDWSVLVSLNYARAIDYDIAYAFKIAMDIVSNGLRILFALIFLSSFVFRPLI